LNCKRLAIDFFFFLRAFSKFRKAAISFVGRVCLSVSQSVSMKQLASYWTGFREIWYWVFLENISRKFQFYYNPTRITGTLLEDQYAFIIISRSVILRMSNVSNTSFGENQNTHFLFNKFFSTVQWKNMELSGTLQMTIW
jgi:hypothetical protein